MLLIFVYDFILEKYSINVNIIMEQKPATMNTIPILFEMLIAILYNPACKAKGALGPGFVNDLLNRVSLPKVKIKV